MPTLRTAGPLDCPDACSLAATVEDGRLVRKPYGRAEHVPHYGMMVPCG